MMGWMFRWDSDLNYNVILIIYSLASTVAIVLYFGEQHYTHFSTQLGTWMTNLKGVYMVFVPYIPCLLWVLITRKAYQRIKLNSKAPTVVGSKKVE